MLRLVTVRYSLQSSSRLQPELRSNHSEYLQAPVFVCRSLKMWEKKESCSCSIDSEAGGESAGSAPERRLNRNTNTFFCFVLFCFPINTLQRGTMVLQRLRKNWALPGFSPFLCYLGADYDNNNKSVINKNNTKGLNKWLHTFTVEIMKLISTFQCWQLELLKPIVCARALKYVIWTLTAMNTY